MENEATFTEAISQIVQSMRPEVGEALRGCAIPHWFDQEMISALRGTPEHSDKILNRLTQFTFVDTVAPERFTLHDNVRESLLAQLRKDPDLFLHYHRQALAEIDRRLEHQADESLELEKIYHQLLVDQSAGLSTLEQVFENAERNRRFSVCEVLIGLLKEVGLTRWADYYSARLAILRFQPKQAQSILLPLLADEDLPAGLHARMHFALGIVAFEQKDWNESIEQLETALQSFTSTGEIDQIAATQLAIAETYADFAYNLKLDSASQLRPQIHPGFLDTLLPLHKRAEWSFKIRYLASSFLYLPLTVYFLYKSSGTTFWHLPRFRWSMQDESPLEQIPVMRLVGHALQWYTAALRHGSRHPQAVEVRLGMAKLLYHFTNPWASSEILQSLVDGSANLQFSEYRLAKLQKNLARSYLAAGQIDLAQPLLYHCLDVFRRYSDVAEQAKTLELIGHLLVFTGPITEAIQTYRESISLHSHINNHLSLGWLVYEIDKLKDRKDVKYRQELSDFLQYTGIPDLERLYFSRTSNRFHLKYMLVDILAVMVCVALAFAPTIVISLLYPDSPLLFLLGLLIIPLSFGPMVWAGFIPMTILMWRDFPFSTLQEQAPRFLRIEENRLVRLTPNGSIDLDIPWSQISGVVSRKMRLGKRITKSLSWLRLYTVDRRVIEISGYTTDFDRVISEIKQHVGQSARWIKRDIGMMTNIRYPMGFWGAFLMIVLPGAFFFLFNSTPILAAAVSAATLFSLIGMPYVGDAAETRPRVPVAAIVFSLGLLTLLGTGGWLLFSVSQEILAAVLLAANGLYWLVWALRRFTHPTYLVPK